MTRSTRLPVRAVIVPFVLAAALLACTLSFNSKKTNSGSNQAPGAANTAASGVAPVVRVLDPVSGASLPRQRVDITVETDNTADRFQVNVGGRVAISKALPPGQSGPTKAILSWTPDRDGTYALEVIAFNGSAASVPVPLALVISGTGGSSVPGSTSGGTGCTGRALVSALNYRDGPGTGANQLGRFDVGESVTVVGRNADSTWYKVQRANTIQVWVIANPQWFQVEGPCGALPVVG